MVKNGMLPKIVLIMAVKLPPLKSKSLFCWVSGLTSGIPRQYVYQVPRADVICACTHTHS